MDEVKRRNEMLDKIEKNRRPGSNCLHSSIAWSEVGYIIILNVEDSADKYFCRPEYKKSTKAILINIATSSWKYLIEDNEWPSHLIKNGCIRLQLDEFDENEVNIEHYFGI